MSLLVCQGKHI